MSQSVTRMMTRAGQSRDSGHARTDSPGRGDRGHGGSGGGPRRCSQPASFQMIFSSDNDQIIQGVCVNLVNIINI